MRKLIAMLIVVMLLAMPVHAAEPPTVQTEDGSAIAITDITPQKDAFDGSLPDFLPQDVQMKTEDGVKLLVKTYEVTSDVTPQSLIESGLTRNGTEYILREVLRETLPGTAEQQTASQIVSVSSESDEREDILSLLPESLDYEENGYTGKLTLDEDSLSTEVKSTSGYTYTVQDSREFAGLERNDPAYIPKTTMKNGLTLTLADVRWSPSPSENEQYPAYSATAYYTGKVTGSAADGYLVTAQYSGLVEKAIPGNIRYSIIYEAVPVPILPESFDWGKTGMISLIVVGCCAIVLFAVMMIRKFGLPRRKKAAVAGFADYEADLEARPERRKPHALGYMKRSGGYEDE